MAVIRFDPVIAVASGSLAASPRQATLGLQFPECGWITAQAITGKDVRKAGVGIRQCFLQKQLGGLATVPDQNFYVAWREREIARTSVSGHDTLQDLLNCWTGTFTTCHRSLPSRTHNIKIKTDLTESYQLSPPSEARSLTRGRASALGQMSEL